MTFVILERDRIAFDPTRVVSIEEVEESKRRGVTQTRVDLREGRYFYTSLSWDELCDALAPVWADG